MEKPGERERPTVVRANHAVAASAKSAAVILFAGGGSGGHIAPGLAIAERLAEFDPHARAIFACSNRAIDADMLEKAGAEFVAMPAAPLRKSPMGLLRFAREYRRTIRMARRLIGERGVTQVVALGGFVAAPVVAAAKRCGVSATLVNLDAPPGKANRLIARQCDRVLSAVALPSLPRFAERIVGLPVRRAAIAPADQSACRAKLGLNPELPTLLVTGASQGARSINALLIELAVQSPEMLRGWQVLHLAGFGDDGPVRAAYQAAGIPALVQPFMHEIGLAWGAADLAISRAGANSVAEVAINAVPCIFLPYPYHRDQHQRHNAEPLARIGGAIIVRDRIDTDENVRNLSPILRDMLAGPGKLDEMRTALRAAKSADAAKFIAEIVLQKLT